MKRIFTLALAAVMVFGLVGCGGGESAEETAMLTEEGATEEMEEGTLIIGEDDVPLSAAPGEDSEVHEYVFAVVDLVNEERAKENLAPLTLQTKATEAAQVRAEEARKTFSHTRPNGTKCFTALAEAGVSYMSAGENLAGRIKTPKKVVDAWMNSPAHRKNIMNEKYTGIGVGYVAQGNYWSQFFVG